MHCSFFSLPFERILLDDKIKDSWRTKVSLHLLEGEGDRAAVEGVNFCAKVTFVIREKFLGDKIRNGWRTDGRLPLVRGAGTAARRD